MRKLIDLFREFITEARNSNISANRSWYDQLQEIYVRYNNICSGNDTLPGQSTVVKPEIK